MPHKNSTKFPFGPTDPNKEYIWNSYLYSIQLEIRHLSDSALSPLPVFFPLTILWSWVFHDIVEAKYFFYDLKTPAASWYHSTLFHFSQCHDDIPYHNIRDHNMQTNLAEIRSYDTKEIIWLGKPIFSPATLGHNIHHKIGRPKTLACDNLLTLLS